MTVTEIHPGAVEETQPIKIVRRLELEWNDSRPLDSDCLFVDHRADIRGVVSVNARGTEFLSVRVDLPDGQHFLLALTSTAQLHLADAIAGAYQRKADDELIAAVGQGVRNAKDAG
jgi:hypothetical protein